MFQNTSTAFSSNLCARSIHWTIKGVTQLFNLNDAIDNAMHYMHEYNEHEQVLLAPLIKLFIKHIKLNFNSISF